MTGLRRSPRKKASAAASSSSSVEGDEHGVFGHPPGGSPSAKRKRKKSPAPESPESPVYSPEPANDAAEENQAASLVRYIFVYFVF